MKLSTRARYALRMMVAIARYSGDGAISLTDIASKTQISRRYLEQLAIALKSATLVRGMAGKGGGYCLTQPARNITLGQIVEAAIGPINIVDCVLNPKSCLESEYCECRWVYQTINDRIVGVLGELSLDDLVDRPLPKFLCNDLALEKSGCSSIRKQSVQNSKENINDGTKTDRQRRSPPC